MLGKLSRASSPSAPPDRRPSRQANLTRAEGEVGERVFQRSFNLPQLGDDARATLLALSLFTPSASRPALAEVAGLGTDMHRLNEAVKRLAALRLIQTTLSGRRLIVEGLTRSLAESRLSIDKRARLFRRQYVVHFARHSQMHSEPTPEDLNALEVDKDNLLAAVDMAFKIQDWARVMSIRGALDYFLYLHGYWDEAIRSGKQAEAAARKARNDGEVARFTGNVASILNLRGEYDEAKRIYLEVIEIYKRLKAQEQIAVSLHQLGTVTQNQGDLEGARLFYQESLKIKRELGHQKGIAGTLHQ